MVKAVFFDLDGTLLDTVHDIRAHLNATLRLFGYPELTLESTKAYIGDGAANLVRRALPDGEEGAFEKCFSEFGNRYANSDGALIKIFPGVKGFLNRQKEQGRILAVITNKPQGAVDVCMRRFFPEEPFAFVSGESGLFPRKPDPSLTRYAALTLRVAPRECVFVGDGETDVLTARNAGMRGIAALWGYRSREQLAAAGAREFVSSFEELEKLLEGA